MMSCSGSCDCGSGTKKASCCSSKSNIIMWKITSKGNKAALRVAN